MVGLMVITHNRIGTALIETATRMLGSCPMPVEVISVTAAENPEDILQQCGDKLVRLNQGDGVIVLTDMYGSTPSNIAIRVCENHDANKKPGNAVVIAGVNLPMLVRLLNYPGLNLQQLIDKALSGGRDGILFCSYRHDV
jgi:PTS system ascorbate-specific IIA component